MSGDAMEKMPPPCVRNCCLNQQDVCLGCFRTLDEILQWRAMTTEQQAACLEKMAERKRQYLKNQSEF